MHDTKFADEFNRLTPGQFREQWQAYKIEPLKYWLSKEGNKRRKKDFAKATIGELIVREDINND